MNLDHKDENLPLGIRLKTATAKVKSLGAELEASRAELEAGRANLAALEVRDAGLLAELEDAHDEALAGVLKATGWEGDHFGGATAQRACERIADLRAELEAARARIAELEAPATERPPTDTEPQA
jgi:chromosome segregation ATPase